MSIVTEIRKTKQKWCLNPRGKAWSEDSNKFGQKMLEKMGWSRGKGLGAKEDGMTEHVKVSYKSDTQGMGYKETDGGWTVHDSDFNSFLQSLSGQVESTNDIKVSSLEEKSQNSRVRVHYKKFTRGKDLSRWSEKDLANIFGKKSLKVTQSNTEEKVEDKDSFFYNGGSMVEYFKKKLSDVNVGSPGNSVQDSESEGEGHVGFGFKTPDKKKRKSNGDLESTPKRLKNEEEERIGLSNPAFDPLFSSVEVQRHVLNTIEEESEEVEKISNVKENKRKTGQNSTEDSPPIVELKKKKKNQDIVVEETELPSQEDLKSNKEIKKTKKKKENCIENPNFEDGNEDTTDYFDENFEVKRKKKKNPDAVSLKSQNCDDDSCQNGFLNENFEVKRKKKSREMALINPVFDSASIENSYVDESYEVKRKKNKEKMAIDNPNFDSNESNEDSTISNTNFEVKRKKKKKKKNSMAIDNPTFNPSEPETKKKRKKASEDGSIDDSIQNLSIIDSESVQKNETKEPSFDLILNVTSTPIVEESTKQPPTVKRRKSVRFSDFNEEKIIPNKEDLKELFDINSKVISNGLKEVAGTSNLAFNRTQLMIDENVNEISKKIDGFQAEIENDMNEAKDRYIGEVGNPKDENEKLPEGTRLKFKYAKFGKTPHWDKKMSVSKAKRSYKHLIKGDIILAFNNTNLHEINGYAVGVNRCID